MDSDFFVVLNNFHCGQWNFGIRIHIPNPGTVVKENNQ